MQNLKYLLDNSKLKATPQRLAILKEIEKKGHASIEDIYEDIKKSFPSISLATIYKNITALQEEDILKSVCTPQKTKYEISKKPHAHFICKKCFSLKDVPLNSVIEEEIEKEYKDSLKELYIYGICKYCKKN